MTTLPGPVQQQACSSWTAVACAEVNRRLSRTVQAYREKILGLLQRAGVGTGEAEDLTQEAFLILARRYAEVPESAELSFLISTALRLASDRRRSAWHRVMVQGWNLDDRILLANSPEDILLSRDRQRRLDAALGTLRDEERMVFALVELEGLTRNEAAFLLHLSPGTVASRLARARKQLNQMGYTAPLSSEPLLKERMGDGANSGVLWDEQLYLMNPWGAEKAQGKFEQRFVEREHEGLKQRGWYWYWPGLDRSVFAYPEVCIGWKPWLGGRTTDSRFPVRVTEIRELVVDYGVETRATGSYNCAISLWLICEPGGTDTAQTQSITTEVMIWPYYAAGVTPLGRLIAQVKYSGVSYELWSSRHHGSRFPGDRQG